MSQTLADLGILVGAVLIGSQVTFGTWLPWRAPGIGTQVLPVLAFMLGGAIVMSLITAGTSGPGVPRPSYGRAVGIVLGTFAITSLLVLVTRVYFSRSLLAYTFALWGAGCIVQRIIRRRRPWTEDLVLLTAEKKLADDLVVAPHSNVLAVIDPQTEDDLEPFPSGATIAVDLRALLAERVAQYVSSCDIAGYNVRPLASVYEEHTGRVTLVHLAEGWEISTPMLRTVPYLPGKRAFDLIATILTLPIWLLLGAGVALAVKLSSPGPIIFRQPRVGKEDRPFTMYKFRTMTADAEDDGPQFAAENDQRLVRGGGFLRKSRLDELPQLWNVLKGEMSLVGPRAEQVAFVAQFKRAIPFYAHRHLVRPGLTGWAQVNYRYADDTADTVEKLTYDLYYIKHMSPVLDLQILWRSLWTVLSGAGAR
jgi:exopolysaccharide biosynthesis polyprenyl glycosylphosphotransferase